MLILNNQFFSISFTFRIIVIGYMLKVISYKLLSSFGNLKPSVLIFDLAVLIFLFYILYCQIYLLD